MRLDGVVLELEKQGLEPSRVYVAVALVRRDARRLHTMHLNGVLQLAQFKLPTTVATQVTFVRTGVLMHWRQCVRVLVG